MTSEPVVIDTNVGIVANAKTHVERDCELACIRRLREITERGHLVLDRQGHIFDEYRRYLSFSGEPGVGDAFMKWVSDNQFNEILCTLVSLTIDGDGDIAEFPTQHSLAGFDPSDKKFVAVAVTHGKNPPVEVALDRDWVRHRTALADIGVEVVFLCPKDIGLNGD